MPRLNYVYQAKQINVSASFPTPKRMNELRFWLKTCQRWCKHIPREIAESEISANRMMGNDGWFVANSNADAKWIRFDLEDKFGNKSQIVIDRKASNM